jgi:hypothetical protein
VPYGTRRTGICERRWPIWPTAQMRSWPVLLIALVFTHRDITPSHRPVASARVRAKCRRGRRTRLPGPALIRPAELLACSQTAYLTVTDCAQPAYRSTHANRRSAHRKIARGALVQAQLIRGHGHPLELPGTVGPAGPGGALAVRVQIARMAPPSTGIIAPVMKDAAGESRNAAMRPNSSGSPYRRSGMR